MGFDPPGAPVAAQSFRPRIANRALKRTPADRARRADPEALGRLSAGHPPATAFKTRTRRSSERAFDMSAGLPLRQTVRIRSAMLWESGGFCEVESDEGGTDAAVDLIETGLS